MDLKNLDNNYRFTKIVATIGPSTEEYENLKAVIEAGVNVCRLNFSHGTHEDHKKRFDNIKRIEKELNKKIAIIADMQGPKLRVGKFKNEKEMLVDGQEFTFDNSEELGDNTRVQLPNVAILDALKVGDYVLINDGKMKVQVIEKNTGSVKTKVIVGGMISDRKGFNLPNTVVDLPVFTEKDLDDLEFALSLGVDWVAASFVQTPDDVRYAKKIINGRASLILKIEKPTAAIDYLEEIVELSDAIMVARGDLGVEVEPQMVPLLQKRMIKVCREKRKPVVVATHMLESMTDNTFPTRAEASDVANAVYEGTDCVMLSAESASGKYPVDAVKMMVSIIKQVEADPEYRKYIGSFISDIKENTLGDVMTAVASDITRKTEAKAVFAYTTSGTTVINLSKHKPNAPIVAVTTEDKVAGRTALCWGVVPKIVETTDSDKIDDLSRNIAKELKLAKDGDELVLTFGKGTATSKSIFKEGATTLVSVIKA
ncbi:MAG: pyruvate kinase [Alphaproteobacteria bacterium]|nr:pyruvate kinase [Alphaproteobacteria bacterium]